MAQALNNWDWVADVRGVLTVQVLAEYLQIWDLVEVLVLQQDIPDQYRLKLSSTGSYSSKFAYHAFFSWGLTNLPHGKEFGKVGLHLNANFSFGWPSIISVGRLNVLPNVGCLTRSLTCLQWRHKISTTCFSQWRGSAVRGLLKEMCKLQRP